MKILDVILTKSHTGFYYDDQRAIRAGNAVNDGFLLDGKPLTEGFTSIRLPGEAITVSLILENGDVASGDCVAVQYSGAAGRDPLFLADQYIPFIEKHLKPLLLTENVTSFKELAKKYDVLEIEGKKLHTAIRYGLSQAFLNARAIIVKKTPAQVIKDEYNLNKIPYKHVPIFTQSGDDRYNNVDKMILKEVDSMPHALINSVDKLGKEGELLLGYIGWLKNRVLTKRENKDYYPIFHIDVYGTIGLAFNNDLEVMSSYIQTLQEVAKPFKLRIEGPLECDTKDEQVKMMKDLRLLLEEKQVDCEIVADEWCNTLDDIKSFADNNAGHVLQIKMPDLGSIHNTIEAALYCKERNIGAYIGGSCNETANSAITSCNVAVAVDADLILGKPGMDVDGAYMNIKNEMNKIIALSKVVKK